MKLPEPELPPSERRRIAVMKTMVSPWETRRCPSVEDAFVESMSAGQINAIKVWYDAERDVFLVASGQRRLLAARKLGWEEIEADVFLRSLSQAEAILIGTLDNIHRADLSDVDRADAIQNYALLTGVTNSDVARAFKLSAPSITRARRLATAPEFIREMVRQGFPVSSADALLETKNETLMKELAALAQSNGWTREQLHTAVKGERPKRARVESIVLTRPRKPSVVLRGLSKTVPLATATTVVRDLLGDMMKASKQHETLGDAAKAWRRQRSEDCWDRMGDADRGPASGMQLDKLT